MNKFQVIVGNIGTVYDGDNGWAATSYFRTCVDLSRAEVGRASGEDVTLMVDDEPEKEYIGWLSMQPEESDDEE